MMKGLWSTVWIGRLLVEILEALVQAMLVSAHASAGIKQHTLIVSGSDIRCVAQVRTW